MFITMSHPSGSRPVFWYAIITGRSPKLRLPLKSQRSCGYGSIGQSIHMPHQDINTVDVRVSQTKTLGVDLGDNRVGQCGPLGPPHSDEGRSQLSYTKAVCQLFHDNMRSGVITPKCSGGWGQFIIVPLAPCGNTDHRHQHRSNCCRTRDPGMALGCSSGPDNTMIPGGNTGHSDHHGSVSDTALRHQKGYMLRPRPRALVSTGASDLGSSRAWMST